MDAIYSPIERISYEVESARVGQDANYDKLILHVYTNGSIRPEDAAVSYTHLDVYKRQAPENVRTARAVWGCRCCTKGTAPQAGCLGKIRPVGRWPDFDTRRCSHPPQQTYVPCGAAYNLCLLYTSWNHAQPREGHFGFSEGLHRQGQVP